MAFATPDYKYNPDSMILDHPRQIFDHLCPEVRKGLAVAKIRMDDQGEFSMTSEQILAMSESIQGSVDRVCIEQNQILFLADHERATQQEKVTELMSELQSKNAQ